MFCRKATARILLNIEQIQTGAARVNDFHIQLKAGAFTQTLTDNVVFFQDRAPMHKFNNRGTTLASATIVEPLSSSLTLKFTECKNHPVALFYTQHFRSQQHIS